MMRAIRAPSGPRFCGATDWRIKSRAPSTAPTPPSRICLAFSGVSEPFSFPSPPIAPNPPPISAAAVVCLASPPEIAATPPATAAEPAARFKRPGNFPAFSIPQNVAASLAPSFNRPSMVLSSLVSAPITPAASGSYFPANFAGRYLAITAGADPTPCTTWFKTVLRPAVSSGRGCRLFPISSNFCCTSFACTKPAADPIPWARLATPLRKPMDRSFPIPSMTDSLGAAGGGAGRPYFCAARSKIKRRFSGANFENSGSR